MRIRYREFFTLRAMSTTMEDKNEYVLCVTPARAEDIPRINEMLEFYRKNPIPSKSEPDSEENNNRSDC